MRNMSDEENQQQNASNFKRKTKEHTCLMLVAIGGNDNKIDAWC